METVNQLNNLLVGVTIWKMIEKIGRMWQWHNPKTIACQSLEYQHGHEALLAAR